MNPSPPPHLPGSYLVLELTNRCSLACVHCSVSDPDHPHHRETGYIDFDLVEALFADLAQTGARFDTFIPFWLGEPLVHPDFGRIWQAALRMAVSYGTFGKVEVHTNATHLDERWALALLNEAPLIQHMHISLDAVTAPTYRRVKGHDRFAQVQDNVTRFMQLRSRLGARWPRPVFQFIVGPNNAVEAAQFLEHWVEVCQGLNVNIRAAAGHVPPGEDAIVFFRQLDCPSPEQQMRENDVFRSTMEELDLTIPAQGEDGVAVRADNRSACSGFWKSPVISWRGEVTTCTRDNTLENQVGSLLTNPFSALWWGAGMRGRRGRVACGDYAGLGQCTTCFIPRSLNYTGLSHEDVARQAAWDAKS